MAGSIQDESPCSVCGAPAYVDGIRYPWRCDACFDLMIDSVGNLTSVALKMQSCVTTPINVMRRFTPQEINADVVRMRLP